MKATVPPYIINQIQKFIKPSEVHIYLNYIIVLTIFVLSLIGSNKLYNLLITSKYDFVINSE